MFLTLSSDCTALDVLLCFDFFSIFLWCFSSGLCFPSDSSGTCNAKAGARLCSAAPRYNPCSLCKFGSTGPCIHQQSGVCADAESSASGEDDACPSGFSMCSEITTPTSTPTSTPTTTAEPMCDTCILGTNGPCQHTNGLCFPFANEDKR